MLAMTSEVPAGLTDPAAKTGGYYELSIWLGDRDDARLQTAIEALASAAGVRFRASSRSRRAGT